jgi:hypothetical protein
MPPALRIFSIWAKLDQQQPYTTLRSFECSIVERGSCGTTLKANPGVAIISLNVCLVEPISRFVETLYHSLLRDVRLQKCTRYISGNSHDGACIEVLHDFFVPTP